MYARHPGSRCNATFAVALAVACSSPPPHEIYDYEAAAIYERVLHVARRELGVAEDVPVHPYLAVIQDSLGYPKAQLDEFEFARSEPLKIMQRADSSLVLCEYNTQGLCSSRSYLVLSQISRTMERDAAVVVLAINADSTPALRYFLVKLKYGRNSWRIVHTELAT